MFPGVRRLPVADRIAALYVLLYVGWMVVRTAGSPATLVIGTAAFVPLGLAVAWANWRNARWRGLDSRTRLAWTLLALSSLCLWLSGTAWTLFLLARPGQAWPGWVEVLETSQNGLALAGYLAFPGQWPPRESRNRFLLDICLTAVAGFVLAF